MKNKILRIFWGIFFLACAGLVIANQLGFLTYHLSFWSIGGTIIFVLSLIDGLINRRISESVFSVAFLLMVYAGPLHIIKLVPWTILLAALLISIGLEIIFHNRFHTLINVHHKIKGLRDKQGWIGDNAFTDTTSNENSAHVLIEQNLSDSSRYIHSQNLETIAVRSRMGDVDIYLDDAQAAGQEVRMQLDIIMTDLTIYLPLAWGVQENINPTLGDFEVDGNSNGGGPTLIVTGRASMSDILIKYI